MENGAQIYVTRGAGQWGTANAIFSPFRNNGYQTGFPQITLIAKKDAVFITASLMFGDFG